MSLPTVGLAAYQDVALLTQTLCNGACGSLSRTPRESLLASCLQLYADSGHKRAGVALLLRKVLKTCELRYGSTSLLEVSFGVYRSLLTFVGVMVLLRTVLKTCELRCNSDTGVGLF